MTRRFVDILAAGALVTCAACSATTQYTPQVVARGELTLAYDDGFQISAGGRQIARGWLYRGLAEHVRCVKPAKEHAEKAATNGRAAIAFSVLGGVIGSGGLLALGALAEKNNWAPWLGSGLGLGSVGLTFSILSWRFKNHANGHAIDATNYYNDSVGSLGATCEDLRYPAPLGPAPGGTLPPIP